MARTSIARSNVFGHQSNRHRGISLGGAIGLSVSLLTGCAVVEGQNRPSSYEVVQQRPRLPDYPTATRARQPDTVYPGWRLFLDRCAGCHGPTATGTSRAPNLMPVMREMDDRRFITHVLYRYEWGIAAQRGGSDAIDAMIDGVLTRKQGELTLPAVGGEPRVSVHIADLYDYLADRAGRGRAQQRPRPY